MRCGGLCHKEIVHKIRQKKQKGKIGTLMGMSASQARLLSITARLTNNELSSQLLTNSKVRLASKSEEASDEYMNALSATKLTYQYYNDNGDAMNYNLTPSVIYSYEPLKSQYSIVDNNGVNLVSAQDAKNFEETDSLHDFLNRYVNVDKVTTPEYDAAKAQYDKDKEIYDKLLDEWENDCKRLTEEYNIAYNEWKNNPYTADNSLYDKFSTAVGTSDELLALGDPDNGPNAGTRPASQGCYWHALFPKDPNSTSCYEHVLNHLIDFNGQTSGNNGNGGRYSTTAGDEIIINSASCGYMGNTCNDLMKEVSDAINEKDENGNYLRLCDDTDDLRAISGVSNRLQQAKDDLDAGKITDTQYKLQQLISDYIDNGDGTYSLKSLKQKAIDLMYVSRNWTANKGAEFSETDLSRDDMVDILINFTDGDMKRMSLAEEPVLNLPEPPEKPIEPPLEEKIVIDDKDKAQWYTNLWYMMNGSESANVVTDDKDETTNGLFVVNGAEKKNPKTANYKVIDDITAKDSSWLQYALENGIVSLRQAKYFNPSEDSGKVPELESTGYMWKSVGFKNAIDIKTVEDTEKITKAQAKYEKATREIEAKDNEYDIQLKNLDTIHNALQTEYESVKNVISKNVERSFKAFS